MQVKCLTSSCRYFKIDQYHASWVTFKLLLMLLSSLLIKTVHHKSGIIVCNFFFSSSTTFYSLSPFSFTQIKFRKQEGQNRYKIPASLGLFFFFFASAAGGVGSGCRPASCRRKKPPGKTSDEEGGLKIVGAMREDGDGRGVTERRRGEMRVESGMRNLRRKHTTDGKEKE